MTGFSALETGAILNVTPPLGLETEQKTKIHEELCMAARLSVRNKQMDWDFFLEQRKQVLSEWPTGKELMGQAALDQAVAYQKSQPWWKFAALRNAQAEKEDRIQLACQVGHALTEQQIEHIKACSKAEPDGWWLWDDTYSRAHKFAKAQEMVERSRRDNYSYLNGYPPAIHGVAGVRAINASTDAYLHSPNNDADGRLTAEIMYAGGCTHFGVQGIVRGFLTLRDTSPEEAILLDQYMTRLAGYYTEQGVPMCAMTAGAEYGWGTAGIKLATSLLGSLMAAEQGIKYLNVLYCQGLNLVEDTAAIQVLKKLTHEYLERFGYKNIPVWTMNSLFHAWPVDRSALSAQLTYSIANSALGGIRTILMKSVDEADYAPTGEGHRQSIAIAKQTLRIMGSQRLPEGPDLQLEREMIEKEVRAVMERILELGDGDVAVGACLAIEQGVLDTQFASWKHLKNKVVAIRDANGAFRYLDAGNVPLPPEVREYHRAKIAEREKREGMKAGLQWVIGEPTWTTIPIEEEAAELSARLRSMETGLEEKKATTIEKAAVPEEKKAAAKKYNVVVGTVGYDSHIVGSTVLRHALEDAGYNVAFLGSAAQPVEFINAARETNAAALWVSSLYGMARIDCADMRAKLVEAGMGDIIMYIGGMLTSGPEDYKVTEGLFLNMGFDRVYPPATNPDIALADLERDLEIRSTKK
ncbi:MAG: methylaspartate mutase subunit S [Chloroflexota bacterium]|nr:MAG: methylaspartate mutase subunit S [Chloroflexota bacterium]